MIISIFKNSTVNNNRSIFVTALFIFCTFTSLNVMSNDCDGFNDIHENCNSSGVFVPDYGLTHALATDRDDSKIVIYDTILLIDSQNKAYIKLNRSQENPVDDFAQLNFDGDSSSVTLHRDVSAEFGSYTDMQYLSYDKIELPLKDYGNGHVIVRNEIVKVRIAVNQHFLWLSAVTTDPRGVQLNVQSATFFTGIPKYAFSLMLAEAPTTDNLRVVDYNAFKKEIARDCANSLRQRSCNTTSIGRLMSILNR